MIKIVDCKLPEFAFVEDSYHDQNKILQGRTIIQHIRTYTVIEAFHEEVLLNDNVKSFKFNYKNDLGIDEEIVFAIHFSLVEDFQLPEVFEAAKIWYIDYLNWEDNIEDSEKIILN